MNFLHKLSALLAATLLASGCAQYASVSERRPILPASLTADGGLAKRIKAALQKRKSQPAEGLSALLLEVRAALRELESNPANLTARDTYNFAVARIIPAGGQSHILTYFPDSQPRFRCGGRLQ